MKARISKFADRKQQSFVEEVVARERRRQFDEDAMRITKVVLWTIMQENEWKNKRLSRLFCQILDNFEWLPKQYESDWEFVVDRDLKKVGLLFDDPQWLKERREERRKP